MEALIDEVSKYFIYFILFFSTLMVLFYMILQFLTYVLIVLFILPMFIVFGFMYASIVYIMFYTKLKLKPGQTPNFEFYEKARKVISSIWVKSIDRWFGMEVKGLENIPTDKPVIIASLHGSVPVDCYYIYLYLMTKKYNVFGITDNFMFKFPGYHYYSKCFDVANRTYDECLERLRNNQILVLQPGGVYEGQTGDHNYKLLWRKRVGFARLAIETEGIIIPMFCENIQEAFRPIGIFKSFWEKLYLKTRLPLVPMFGGVPVKLTIHLGKPIAATKYMDPWELRTTTKQSLEAMIKENQKLPGSITKALKDRVLSLF